MRLWLIIIAVLILFCSCEQGKNKSVTGALFNGKPGKLKNYTIGKDSINVATKFNSANGRTSYLLCGNYQDASAFSIVKFSKPSSSILDSLDYALVGFDIYKTWKTGDLEIELYNTNSDWSDTTKIIPSKFLDTLGSPITVFSDTASTKVEFFLNKENFSDWSSSGSFLLKTAKNIDSMVNFYSVNSAQLPYIKLVTHNGAASDTTTIKSIAGNYYYSSGYSGSGAVVSDGGDDGFVLKLGIPKLDINPVSINNAILKLTFPQSLVLNENLTMTIYRLDKSFTNVDSTTIDTSSSIQIIVTPTIKEYNVNILNYIHAWLNLGKVNYGILVRSYSRNASPNFVVIEPPDSLAIKYTTIPEVN